MRGQGFTPINRLEYYEVNLDQLERIEDKKEVNPKTLIEANLVRNSKKPIVLLGRGEVNKVLDVKVHRISKSAKSKIEAAGGKIEIIEFSN